MEIIVYVAKLWGMCASVYRYGAPSLSFRVLARCRMNRMDAVLVVGEQLISPHTVRESGGGVGKA